MVAVLISGGAIEEEFAVGFLDKCKADQIIAVDRGLTFCKRYGIRPNCIVGDFDSLPGGILEEYEKDTDIMIKRLIPERMIRIRSVRCIWQWIWGQRSFIC